MKLFRIRESHRAGITRLRPQRTDPLSQCTRQLL